jgi:hypothetical protein
VYCVLQHTATATTTNNKLARHLAPGASGFLVPGSELVLPGVLAKNTEHRTQRGACSLSICPTRFVLDALAAGQQRATGVAGAAGSAVPREQRVLRDVVCVRVCVWGGLPRCQLRKQKTAQQVLYSHSSCFQGGVLHQPPYIMSNATSIATA